jgi:hypothetical protein
MSRSRRPPQIPPEAPLPVCDHARERMAARFGRDLTREEWLQVVGAIVNRRAVLVRAAEPATGRETYAVSLGDVVFHAVWQPANATIVTVLEPRKPRRDTPPPKRRVVERKAWLRGKRRTFTDSATP